MNLFGHDSCIEMNCSSTLEIILRDFDSTKYGAILSDETLYYWYGGIKHVSSQHFICSIGLQHDKLLQVRNLGSSDVHSRNVDYIPHN